MFWFEAEETRVSRGTAVAVIGDGDDDDQTEERTCGLVCAEDGSDAAPWWKGATTARAW